MAWIDERMRSVRARTALVTGASGGIGLELAHLCARDGANLVLVARRATELTRIAADLTDRHKIRVDSFIKDLSEPDAALELVDQLNKEGTAIDILINNAGFGDYGPFADSDLERQRAMIHLNITSLVELTHLLLPRMIQERWGRVLNVASLAAFQPGPLMSVYYATKAFVLHFSEAIANELEGTGVSVTALCPGPVHTGFAKAANATDSALFKKLGAVDVKKVARTGYEAMLRGKSIAIPGFKNRVLAGTVGFMPRGAVVKISRSLQGA